MYIYIYRCLKVYVSALILNTEWVGYKILMPPMQPRH